MVEIQQHVKNGMLKIRESNKQNQIKKETKETQANKATPIRNLVAGIITKDREPRRDCVSS